MKYDNFFHWFIFLIYSLVRLCAENNCTGSGIGKQIKEGFLEYFNSTTSQWVPICDQTFVEQNAKVVCRQLGLDSLNVWVSRDRRYEFLPNALTRIWSWPEPLQCSGEYYVVGHFSFSNTIYN